MNPAEIQSIRASFPAICAMAGPPSVLFYGRLFELDPTLRPMFRQDIAMQGRKLMNMLTSVVGNLDDLESLTPVLRPSGKRHVGYVCARNTTPRSRAPSCWRSGSPLKQSSIPTLS
jgi:hemoglobin-like flavoprotein